MLLHAWVDVREGADGARDGAGGDILARGDQAGAVACELGMRLGEGSGAAVALPVLRAAVATLASMATFEEAGIGKG